MNDHPQDQTDPFVLLEERLDNPPKLWTPKGAPSDRDPDECIVEKSVKGIAEEVDLRTGEYGEYPIAILVRRDKSRVQVSGFGTVLGDRLRQVRVGDAVGITYLGTKPSTNPGMKDYDNYDVVVLRDGRPPAPLSGPPPPPPDDPPAATGSIRDVIAATATDEPY